MIDTHITAHHLKIRQKHKKSFLSGSMFYYILTKISKLPYKRDESNSRFKKLGEFYLAMDLQDFPIELKEKDYTKIDFFIGKESQETWLVRDPKGKFESLGLPEGKNLCFKTHGSFLFKKEGNNWNCILIIERRHICIGLWSLFDYLKLIDLLYSFDSDVITTEAKYLERIKELADLKYAIIKNHNWVFDKNDGIGTIKRNFDESGYKVTNLKIDLVRGNTPLEKIKNLVIDYLGLKNRDVSNEDIEDFVNKTELVLIGREKGSIKRKCIDLFKDLIYYNFKVESAKGREIDTDDFFNKLNGILTEKEINKLFKLVEKEKQ